MLRERSVVDDNLENRPPNQDGVAGVWAYTWNFNVLDASFDNIRAVAIPEPLDGDLNDDGVLNVTDIDLLSTAVRVGNDDQKFDLNGDGRVDQIDRTVWVEQLRKTWFGDANLDGEFDSEDFVQVFQVGQVRDAGIRRLVRGRLER